MKRYGILALAVLVVAALALPLFGQEEKAEKKVREAVQQQPQPAPRGERARGGRGRWMSREDQQKAIATIEEQLGKLKGGMEEMPRGREGWRDLSDEERQKLRERFMKMREERQQALATIEEQVAKLKGSRELRAEYDKAISELEAVGKLAAKEKAKETAAGIEKLIAEKKKELEEKLQKLGLGSGQGPRSDRGPR